MEKVPLPHSVAAVEALATVRALRFAHDLNLSSVILEDDSEMVIKALRSEDESFSSHGHLIAEAKLFIIHFILLVFLIFADIVMLWLTILDMLDMLAVFSWGWRMFHHT